jgi:type II secretory ATPase GspE/PulE/Tfp pilus assembly ATPase PilB-like protein
MFVKVSAFLIGIGSKEILRSILQEAIDLGASDIHIRPRNSTHICFLD